MSNYVKNLNKYINHYKIKKSFIIKKTGIEKNKFSRILNNIQDIYAEDMDVIAEALGKEVSYFTQNEINLTSTDYKDEISIAFYMGSEDTDKIELANQVFDFLEHIDAILSIRKNIEKNSLKDFDYEFKTI